MTEDQFAVTFDVNALRDEVYRLRYVIEDMQSILSSGDHPDIGLDAEEIVEMLRNWLIREPDGPPSQVSVKHDLPINPLEDLRTLRDHINANSYQWTEPSFPADYAGIMEMMVESQQNLQQQDLQIRDRHTAQILATRAGVPTKICDYELIKDWPKRQIRVRVKDSDEIWYYFYLNWDEIHRFGSTAETVLVTSAIRES